MGIKDKIKPNDIDCSEHFYSMFDLWEIENNIRLLLLNDKVNDDWTIKAPYCFKPVGGLQKYINKNDDTNGYEFTDLAVSILARRIKG